MTTDTYRVSFEVQVPAGVAATPEEVTNWVAFCVHATGGLSLTNPLVDFDIEANFDTLDVSPA